MHRFKFAPMILVALLGVPATAQAQLGVDFSSIGTNNNDSYTLGWGFDVLSPFSVTALGFFDAGQDGFSQSHDVGLYTSTGTLLASTTVSNSDPLISFWRFANITPLVLGTGSYIIAGVNGSEVYPVGGGTGVTFNPKISYGTDWYSVSTSLIFPTTSSGYSANDPTWLAANFIGSDATHAEDVVPEPATMSLLATGLVGLAAATRRKKIPAA